MNKYLLIPAFLLVLSCNDTQKGLAEVCPLHMPLYNYLTIEFSLTSSNPVRPELEIEGEKVDYCFSGQEKPYCLFNLTSGYQKLTYKIAAKKELPLEDVSVDLFDDTARRLSRTTEEMTTFTGENSTSCFTEISYSLKIQE